MVQYFDGTNAAMIDCSLDGMEDVIQNAEGEYPVLYVHHCAEHINDNVFVKVNIGHPLDGFSFTGAALDDFERLVNKCIDSGNGDIQVSHDTLSVKDLSIEAAIDLAKGLDPVVMDEDNWTRDPEYDKENIEFS